jgi:predicted  nucleic acid-binding Zn-ribbon protein
MAPGALQVGDIEFDARLLGEYGDPPRHWILSGLYAWRVLRRQREIRQALDGRREEATRSATELEDALVALAERVKPAADQKAAYGEALAEAKRAEDKLRSRDAVLAAEQDAHNARLAAVEARLAKLEAELVEAQGAERSVVAEISTSQGALGRAEAKLKRAEGELRAAAKADTGEP